MTLLSDLFSFTRSPTRTQDTIAQTETQRLRYTESFHLLIKVLSRPIVLSKQKDTDVRHFNRHDLRRRHTHTCTGKHAVHRADGNHYQSYHDFLSGKCYQGPVRETRRSQVGASGFSDWNQCKVYFVVTT